MNTMWIAVIFGILALGFSSVYPACITSCDGIDDGDYQSCQGCNVYASCGGGGTFTDNRPCPAELVWDDSLKRCEWESATCSTTETPEELADYQCKPVVDKSSAAVHLPFDTLTDGQFADGTLTTSTLHGTAQTVEGKVGQALSLDGSTAISIGERTDGCIWDVEQCPDGFTVALWVYNVNRENNDQEPYLLSSGGQTSSSYGVALIIESGSADVDRGLIVSASTKTKKVGITDASWKSHAKDDVWKHIAVTFKDEEMMLFEDGVFVAAATMSDRDPALTETEFNQYTFGLPNNGLVNPDSRFWGVVRLDEFLFWDDWKSGSFILDLYNTYQDTSSLSECDENHKCTKGVCECANGRAGTNCNVDRQVLMRVATNTKDAGTVFSLWTDNTFTPAKGDPLGPEYFSLSVDDKQRYKSPLVEQAWSKVKNVRFSYYKDSVEVAYFSSTAEGTDKITWFGKDYVYDSSFGDLLTETECNFFSIEGHLTEIIQRRYFVNKNYGGCEVDAGWFVLLDTGHNNNCAWETFDDLTTLPFLMYCPEKTACLASEYAHADVLIVSADLGEAFGGSCVSSCVGLADGNYQSCQGCNVYAVCASQTLTHAACRSGTRFDSEQGSCVESSSTCDDDDAAAEGLPNGCDPNPCRNNGECSMDATGWVCACSTDTSGYGGPTCEDVALYCTVYSDNNVCNNGTCEDEADGDYSCTCNPGYTGEECETLASYCTAFADSTPCKNGGECSDLSEGQFECNCTAGYKGKTCTTETYCKANENNAAVCSNGGTCVDHEDKVNHHCDCGSGYMGENCDEETFCTANPGHCQNEGECADNGKEFDRCSCAEGYLGTTCGIENQCVKAAPCQNGAACSVLEDGAADCTCTEGWRGSTCGDEDVCATNNNPCENNGACGYTEEGSTECTCTSGWMGSTCGDEDVCVTNSPCGLGGTCGYTEEGSTKCTCTEGWLGTMCDVEDPCGEDTCQNEGACTTVQRDDGTYTFSCTCGEHFSGDTCEEGPCQTGDYVDQCAASISCTNNPDGTCQVVTACSSNPCSNNGVCSDSDGKYACDCSDTGYTGDQCNEDSGGEVGSAGKQEGETTEAGAGGSVAALASGATAGIVAAAAAGAGLTVYLIKRKKKQNRENQVDSEDGDDAVWAQKRQVPPVGHALTP